MKPAAGGRLASLDALRGITVAAMLLVNNPGDWGHVYAPLLHAEWHGCTPTDLIFPFFLFLVGVSMAFSVVPRAQDAAARPGLARGVLERALRILLAGALLHALAWWLLELPHYRLWGVLQRIALCSALVGLLAVFARRTLQWGVLALLLGTYSVILLGADTLQPLLNPASRLDTALFAPWLYQWHPDTGLGHDPEGLLSSLGAVATTLLGLIAGQLLRARQPGRLALLGGLLLVAGALATVILPLNKNLWTPSYVCWTAGFAVLALLAAHWLVDQRGWPALGRRYGVNAISAYLGSGAMALVLIASGTWAALYGALSGLFGDPMLASLASALLFVLFWWVVVWRLDARGIHLRI